MEKGCNRAVPRWPPTLRERPAAPMNGDDSGGVVMIEKNNGVEKNRPSDGSADGQGSLYARHVAALRKAIADAITPEATWEIMEVMLAKAMKGDVGAARLWLRYAGRVPCPRRGREVRGG